MVEIVTVENAVGLVTKLRARAMTDLYRLMLDLKAFPVSGMTNVTGCARNL
jgi:hypothetical protein